MSISTTDLRYVTPDADGTLKMNRGATPADSKAGVAVPFASFKGDIRFYRGKAADVGVGDLLGWQVVAGVSAGTLVRIAMSDAEVGVVSGSNTITPTGTLPVHDHNIPNDPVTTTTPNETSGDTYAGGGNNWRTAHHHTANHDHFGSTTGLIAPPPIVMNPTTINPQAVAFYLIEYVGVTS